MDVQGSLFPETLSELLVQENKLKIAKSMAIEKAMKGNDVEDYYQAQSYLKEIEKREIVASKSLLVDPMALSATFGYKDKPFALSYQVLRAMSQTHIVKAVIETRRDQVLNFCEPQNDKYSPGFVIQRRTDYTQQDGEKDMSTGDKKKVAWLTEYLLSCGTTKNFWNGGTFDEFMAKLVMDALTFDQATFEIVRNRKGDVIEFFATDGGSYRIADTFGDTEEDTKYPEKIIQGYAPSYVQLYQGRIHKEFYPWELCFGIRNPQTDLRYNGYGRCELEDLIATITSLLNADQYNSNFFRVGAAPKGILRYSGQVNQNTLEDFRRQWIAQVSGAMNAHKIPMLNADKMEFINTNVPNKDMEFSKFQEFLIKIVCAIYKIDPSEIGFSMSGNSQGTSGLGGNDHAEKIKHSKDKGLKPLLKKIQFWINKYIIWQVDPEFEFKFVGVEQDEEQDVDLENDVTSVQNFMTLNEVRKKRNLEPIEGGDIPLNPVFLQAKGMEQQQAQMDAQNNAQGMAAEGEDPFTPTEEDQQDQEEDPFTKSLNADIELLLNTEI